MARTPIIFTEAGIAISVKLVQLVNALFPIVVTELGIEKLVKPLQL